VKLLSIEIENFRQFHGKHRMDLDTRGRSNVIVIHGENGAGKTTLLNAFKWCFYGQTDFDSGGDNLLNERAMFEAAAGARLTMAVTVQFENDGGQYTAKRDNLFRKDLARGCEPMGEGTFTLTWTDASGAAHTSPNPSTHMSQILPEKMQPYFFFNGERIEKLAHVNAAGQVQSAIKNLMGLEIVERAAHHLGGPVIARLRKELKDTSSADLADALERESVMSDKVKEVRAEIAQTDRNIRDFEEELQQVNRALEASAEVANLHKARLDLEQQCADIRQRLGILNKERGAQVGALGGLAFAEKLFKTAGAILDEKRKKGELPSKVKGKFIEDLLERQLCICERDLTPGTPPHFAVHAFKSSATSADVEDAFITTSGQIGPALKARENLFVELTTFQVREREYTDQLQTKLGQIDEISSKIGNRESEDIAALETKRGQLYEEIKRSVALKGALGANLQEWTTKLGELTKERERLSAKSERNAVATQRLKLADEVKRVLDALYNALAEQVRHRLSTKVDETFKAIMRKPYWAEISNTYTLEIYKSIGGAKQLVYEKSTGESQVTSLSFVGSIVSLAKERASADTENFRGGVFPIVMDSPFGALDADYREKIAEYIPELAEQVIIMVSTSQWKGEVASQVTHRMAREYTLQYTSPVSNTAPEGGSSTDAPQFEYTEIKEGCYAK
jgi:DNA sulfur modification protein DndD